MTTGRTLHVRCATWEQVEVFHTRKLRQGKLLSMRVPFEAAIGMPVTLGLELPNGVVIAIEGAVQKASPIDGDTRTWIEVELPGFTEDVRARLRQLAEIEGAALTPAPAPAPAEAAARAAARHLTGDELPADERALFQQLTTELRRLRQLPVHDVLGVAREAEPAVVRAAWLALVRRHHPDLVARRRAPALSHLAEELTILVNRAYDRLRAQLVAEGRAIAVGSAAIPLPGWLVGFDDIASVDSDASGRRSGRIPVAPVAAAPSGPVAGQGGETFESRARTMLLQGSSETAQEVLAAALVVYPRSRALRSLYYVASAVAALDKGDLGLATSQLESALAHDEHNLEAARILEHLATHESADAESIRRLFR